MKITIEYDTEMDALSDQDKRILSAIIDDSDNGMIGDADEHAVTAKVEKAVAPVVTVETAADTTPQVDVNTPCTATPLIESSPETAPAGQPQLDGMGVPWDPRIHSTVSGGGGKLTTKGIWAKKRGVNDLLYNQVIAELQGKAAPTGETVATGETDAAGNEAHEPATNVAQGAFGQPPTPTPDAIPGVPSTPETNQALTPDPEPQAVNFPMLLNKVNERLQQNPAYQQTVQAVLTANGLNALPDLLTRADLLEAVNTQLDQAWDA